VQKRGTLKSCSTQNIIFIQQNMRGSVVVNFEAPFLQSPGGNEESFNQDN
jgi:hypothetical protein